MELSALQKHIIQAIANNTINTYECDKAGLCGCNHDLKENRIAYAALFAGCRYWDELPLHDSMELHVFGTVSPALNARKASFSRALHQLVEPKGLVSAWALAWMASDTVSRRFEFMHWQGGGRGKKDRWNLDTPRYRMLELTDEGWEIARSLINPTIGMCPYLREYRA
jgi:hypothetical protein